MRATPPIWSWECRAGPGLPSCCPAASARPRRRCPGRSTCTWSPTSTPPALAGLRGQLSLPSDILIVLLVMVAAAISGGFWPGITAAVAGFLLLNYYFTESYHTFAMSYLDNVVALAVFVAVAAAVSAMVADRPAQPGCRPGRGGRRAAVQPRGRHPARRARAHRAAGKAP